MELYCSLVLGSGIACIGLLGNYDGMALAVSELSVEYQPFNVGILICGL